MAIKFSGVFEVEKKPAEVYDFLTDPREFARLLHSPAVVVRDATHFGIKAGNTLFAKEADVNVELSVAERPERAQYKGKGTAAGNAIQSQVDFELAPTAYGTTVNWRAEGEISGRLAAFAGAVLEPFARKHVYEWMNRLRDAIAA